MPTSASSASGFSCLLAFLRFQRYIMRAFIIVVELYCSDRTWCLMQRTPLSLFKPLALPHLSLASVNNLSADADPVQRISDFRPPQCRVVEHPSPCLEQVRDDWLTHIVLLPRCLLYAHKGLIRPWMECVSHAWKDFTHTVLLDGYNEKLFVLFTPFLGLSLASFSSFSARNYSFQSVM